MAASQGMLKSPPHMLPTSTVIAAIVVAAMSVDGAAVQLA